MTRPVDPPRRLHTAGEVGGAIADVVATWPLGASISDIEEAIKTAARSAIQRARERIGERQ